MYRRLFRVLVLLSVVVSLSGANVFAAPKEKRVKGTLKGTISFSPTNIATGVYTVTVEAVGNVSHLGRTTAVWQGDVALDANLQATPLTGLGWTLTTPKGTLHGPILWQATNATSNPLVYSLTGTFQSTGGTRKLQKASAQGTVTATIDLVAGKTTIHLNGFLNRGWKKLF